MQADPSELQFDVESDQFLVFTALPSIVSRIRKAFVDALVSTNRQRSSDHESWCHTDIFGQVAARAGIPTRTALSRGTAGCCPWAMRRAPPLGREDPGRPACRGDARSEESSSGALLADRRVGTVQSIAVCWQQGLWCPVLIRDKESDSADHPGFDGYLQTSWRQVFLVLLREREQLWMLRGLDGCPMPPSP